VTSTNSSSSNLSSSSEEGNTRPQEQVCRVDLNSENLDDALDKQLCSIHSSSRGPPEAKVQRTEMLPVMTRMLQIKLGTPKGKPIMTLLHSGASATMIREDLALKKVRVLNEIHKLNGLLQRER
jgi:hypothetical protein